MEQTRFQRITSGNKCQCGALFGHKDLKKNETLPRFYLPQQGDFTFL